MKTPRPMDLVDDSFLHWLEWVITQTLTGKCYRERFPGPHTPKELASLTQELLQRIAEDYPERAGALAAAEHSIVTGVVARTMARARH